MDWGDPIPILLRRESEFAHFCAAVPRRLACWSSRSFICCSRSISMIKGTTRMRKVVPAIHAALPVLFRSFFVTNVASDAACFPRETISDCEILAITPLSSFLEFRRSGRETPPLRAWDAMDDKEERFAKVLHWPISRVFDFGANSVVERFFWPNKVGPLRGKPRVSSPLWQMQEFKGEMSKIHFDIWVETRVRISSG